MSFRPIRELLEESRAAVQAARQHSRAAQASALLQVSGADDTRLGALPYTPEAIAAFEAAFRTDPENPTLAHHLAIAWHARAWDLDLAGDPSAQTAWTTALGYWRKVANAPEFWSGLRARLNAIDPTMDPGFLAEARRRLLEDLLDVHVAFVRHYIECGQPQRSVAHVAIIKAAELPPAVKNRFTAKVYAVMTAGVDEARAGGNLASALTSLERFLELFPTYLPALRAAAEICKEWVSGLSYIENWEDISALCERIETRMTGLARHPNLSSDPLAGVALEALCQEVALRGQNRATSLTSEDDLRSPSPQDRAQAQLAFDLAIRWGRLGQPFSPPGSTLVEVLAVCLNNYALARVKEGIEVQSAEGIEPELQSRALILIFRQAVALMDETVALMPDVEIYQKNRAIYANELARLEAEALRFHLFRLDDLP